MSAVVPSQRKIWIPILTVFAVGLAVLIALVNLPDSVVTAPGEPSPEVLARQVAWRIKTVPHGKIGKLTKAERARIKSRSKRVRSLVKDVYDAARRAFDATPGGQ